MTQAIPMVRQQISTIPSPNGSRVFSRYSGPPPSQAAGSCLGDGRVVVVYEAFPGQQGGVFARIVLPDDTLLPEISVDPNGYNASVAMGIDNTFAVVYCRDFGSKVRFRRTDRHVIIRTFNPDGSPKYVLPIEPEITADRLHFLGRSKVVDTSVAALSDGKFAVIWSRGFRGLKLLPSFPHRRLIDGQFGGGEESGLEPFV
jgi:hypothetical protein